MLQKLLDHIEAILNSRAEVLRSDKPVALWVFLVAGLGWLLYNVGLNIVGMDNLWAFIDEINGSKIIWSTKMPAWEEAAYWGINLFVATLASGGQALLQQYPNTRRHPIFAPFLLSLMAADVALNTFGAYAWLMPLEWPPHFHVLTIIVVVTLVFNIGLQALAHYVWVDILFPPIRKHHTHLEPEAMAITVPHSQR